LAEPPTQRIELYDVAGALRLRDSILPVYLAAHLDQQHDLWATPERFWERLEERYAPTKDFALVAGWLASSMVGYAFGSVRDNTAEIWEAVRASLADVPVPPQPEPVYIFREFAVHPDHQGKGYGHAFHDALLSTRAEPLAHLLVRLDNLRATSAYTSWGWRRIGETRPFPDSPLMNEMVRPLPLTAHGRGGPVRR
jgi:GNAT superfamily N-acetyltransferase